MNHFFGYYGINPWDPSGRFHLALATDFDRRPPMPEDQAIVGLVDGESGAFSEVSRTRAFNFQQGSMLHWINTDRGVEFTHNIWEKGLALTKAINLADRSSRLIGSAIAAISPDGTKAMGLNYARMYHCRSVVGYANEMDPITFVAAPEDDGLYRIDLATGVAELVVSIAQVLRSAGAYEDVVGKEAAPAGGANAGRANAGRAWFNHVMFNTDGSRLLFFCRYRHPDGSTRSSLWTVNPDGSDLQLQIGFDYKISHFAWQDEDTILISTDLLGKMQFFLGHDGRDDFVPIGEEVLPADGHACFSSDRKLILCDTYPDRHRNSELLIYEVATNRKTSLGFFHSEEIFRGDIRCDLHPRWTPDGRAITIDAVSDGERQIYLVDVSDLVS